MDATYTNGVIAAKEKYLLKDKIFKLCETGAEEALRTLTEANFGKGAEISSAYEYERLVAYDEAAIDEFIREYVPSRAEAEYLLAPRDFHNAKALVKAHCLNIERDKMLAPDGLIPVSVISDCIEGEKFEELGKELGGAVEAALKLFSESDGEASGAEVGAVFEKALYSHLKTACKSNGVLKKMLTLKADMTNILTAMRSEDAETAQKYYVTGGKLSEETLEKLFSESSERAWRCFENTPYYDFVKICFSAKAEGLPLTAAENILESFETKYFYEKRFELKRTQPFLFYVFRRRAENANVRILFVCLLAGMKEGEIKKRLRF